MATFTELAETKPRMRRDVLFTETPKGVLFHNAKGGFHVNAASAYRLASLLVPHLDGTITLRELAGGVGEQQQAMMAGLVSTLYQRGFARDAAGDRAPSAVGLDQSVANAFAAQLDYIAHYVADPAARFARFRQTAFAVLGDGPVAAAVAAGLLRNGAARVSVSPRLADQAVLQEAQERLEASGTPASPTRLPAGPLTWDELSDVHVACVSDAGAEAQVRALTDPAPPAGRLVLPAWRIGSRIVMGPLVGADSAADWSSAVRAIGREFPAAEADLWHRVAQPDGAPPAPEVPAGPMAAMVGNHLAYELFRLTTGCLPAETREGVIVQDVESLDVRSERLLPDPSRLGTLALPDGGPLPDPHEDDYDAQAHEGAAESDPVAVQLNSRTGMVQRHCGIISEFTDSRWTQVPLKLSTADYHRPGAEVVALAAASVDHVADARLRLLDDIAVRHASAAVNLPGAARRPADVQAARFLHAAHALVDSSEWTVPARNLTSQEVVRVPLDVVTPGHPWAMDGFGDRPIGWGAASTPQAAVARGLRAAVLHAALRGLGDGAVARRLSPTTLHTAATGRTAATLRFLAEAAVLVEVDLEVLSVPVPGRAAAVVIARDPVGGGYAVGGGLDEAHAVIEAMRDLIGTAQLHRQGWTGAALGQAPIDQFEPWSVDVTETVEDRKDPVTWAEVAQRAQIAGCSPVAVRTTTRALRAVDVETVAVLLHRDRA